MRQAGRIAPRVTAVDYGRTRLPFRHHVDHLDPTEDDACSGNRSKPKHRPGLLGFLADRFGGSVAALKLLTTQAMTGLGLRGAHSDGR
jgi:hypothetical protein